MKYYLYFAIISVIVLDFAKTEESSYRVERIVAPTPKFFGREFSNFLLDTSNKVSNRNADLSLLPVILKELSYNNNIIERKCSTGDKFLEFIPTENARDNETILLFSNSSKLNLTENIQSRLSKHGDSFRFVDLSTVDADDKEINTLLSFTKQLNILIMPIIGSYSINNVNIPESVSSLVVYNQKISQDFFKKNQNIKNLVLWGCEIISSYDLRSLPYSSNYLSKITLINSGINLSTFIQNSNFQNLEEASIDYLTMLWRMIERKSIKHINFYTYKYTRFNEWPESLITRNFKSLRSSESPHVTINIFYDRER